MKASDAFKDGALAPGVEFEDPDEEAKALEKLKFVWHSKLGIVKNISILNKEFNEFRGLNPVKIFITGPPASGKTFYSD